MNQDRVNNVIVKITVTHWHKERHAHSLFSCPSSNSSLKRTERKNLRVPLFFFAPKKIFWLREIQPFSPLPKLQLLAFPTLHPKPFLLEQSFTETLHNMAKTRPGRKDLDSYTIRGTNKIVRAGDCVLMRPSDTSKPPYVARVEKIEQDSRNNVKVRVRWYYRPEESIGGRRQFHGAKELFLSDHYDVQSAHTIEGKCIVHSFKNYTKLENVGAEDYYCRFEYKAATGAFTPDRVAVYCKCEMPYNPDDLMVQCEGCKDWYHPACVGMTIEEAKKLEHFVCSECSSDDDMKKPHATFSVSPGSDVKVRLPASSHEQFELSQSGGRDDHHEELTHLANATLAEFRGLCGSCCVCIVQLLPEAIKTSFYVFDSGYVCIGLRFMTDIDLFPLCPDRVTPVSVNV
ncbi:Chromatin remodeling protein EBS isoform B [Glycine soja]|uniref:Chromatin remodeling protein EBS isoform B n=1 Tax=Glycine soja TaxID=3848 RepID=A0A445IAQ2_GLYSO|nr:Chromatin remodeling protein EBS isoform B [Glycine soja]